MWKLQNEYVFEHVMVLVHIYEYIDLLIHVHTSLVNPNRCLFSLCFLLVKYKYWLYLYAIYNDTSQHWWTCWFYDYFAIKGVLWFQQIYSIISCCEFNFDMTSL